MKRLHQLHWLRAGSTQDHKIAADQQKLLQLIWAEAAMEARYGCLCFRKRDTRHFEDHFVKLKKLNRLAALLVEYDRSLYDQFFCPNTFSKRDRRVEFVCDTRLGWCDIDAADPSKFRPKPSILWQTSPDNTQAIWFWGKLYDPGKAASFSKALTYRYGGDKGGWAANKLLRIPGSINHKPEYDRPFVTLLRADSAKISKPPKVRTSSANGTTPSKLVCECDPSKDDPQAVLQKYGSRIDAVARMLARHKSVRFPDRSKQIYMMIRGLYFAGATLNEIACVVWNSIYFQDKYGTSLSALEAEISRIVAKLEASK